MKKSLFSIYKTGVRIFRKTNLTRYYPIRSINNLLRSYLKPNFIRVGRHKMFLDKKDSSHLSVNKIFEPFETEVVKKEIKEGDVALDLGANIGYYTLIFAELVGEKGKVYAFEPEPNNFALLKKNIETNGYKNTILINKAVSNKNGKIKFYLNKESIGAHSIYNYNKNKKSIEVESIKLDDYFKNYNKKIDFIKMDIERAELEAIKGASDILNNNSKIKIITEISPQEIKKIGKNPKELFSLLDKYNFKLYDINEKEKKLERIFSDEILKKYSFPKGNYTNLLCIKK